MKSFRQHHEKAQQATNTLLHSPIPLTLYSIALSSTAGVHDSLVPYLQVMRFDKPAGTLIAYAPYIFGCLFTASVPGNSLNPAELQALCLRIFPAVAIFRALGCVWNDIVDRDFDEKTERCQNRPIAHGTISVYSACILCIGLLNLALGLVMLGTTSAMAFAYFLPIPFLTTLYPFAKRVTNFPQLLLGLTFSQSILFGTAQAGLPLHHLILGPDKHGVALGLVSLWMAYIVWTLMYDTIYAFQDVQDDLRTGVISMAVRYIDRSGMLLRSLSVIQCLILWGVGSFTPMSTKYFWIVCGGISCLLICLNLRLDVSNTNQCRWWFQYGTMLYTIIIGIGLGCEYRYANFA